MTEMVVNASLAPLFGVCFCCMCRTTRYQILHWYKLQLRTTITIFGYLEKLLYLANTTTFFVNLDGNLVLICLRWGHFSKYHHFQRFFFGLHIGLDKMFISWMLRVIVLICLAGIEFCQTVVGLITRFNSFILYSFPVAQHVLDEYFNC
jgi:hypothetical protein